MGKHFTSAGGERNATLLLCPLENVFCAKKIKEGKDRRTKFETEDKEGIWLGHNRGTNEALVGTPPGVVRACSFRSRDDASRWSPALISGMKGNTKTTRSEQAWDHIPIKMQMIGPEHLEEPVAVEATPSEAVIPRRFRIMTDMLAAYGYSAGCAGCRHKRSGFTGPRDHTDACRRRIAEAIRADNSEIGSRFKVSVFLAQVRLGHSKESQDAVVLADEPERVEEDGGSTPVLSERAPWEEEAVLDALEDNPEEGSVVDVVEMYSSPRTTPVARRMVLVAGQALDLLTGCDFRLPRHKEAALRYVRKVRPKLVIGSPGCTVFSQLQNVYGSHWDRNRRDRLEGGAESHAVHCGGVLGTSQSRTLVFA